MYDREHYLNLRSKHEPEHPRLIFVAESPPASGKYFYDPTGILSESLFAAMMQLVLSSRPQSVVNGLDAFRASGYVLVDATYQPVNKDLTDNQRRDVILRDYPLLKEDLLSLTPDQDIPLILIKKNVCLILEPMLARDAFRVLNDGRIIPFPSHWHREAFQTKMEPLLQSIE